MKEPIRSIMVALDTMKDHSREIQSRIDPELAHVIQHAIDALDVAQAYYKTVHTHLKGDDDERN